MKELWDTQRNYGTLKRIMGHSIKNYQGIMGHPKGIMGHPSLGIMGHPSFDNLS